MLPCDQFQSLCNATDTPREGISVATGREDRFCATNRDLSLGGTRRLPGFDPTAIMITANKRFAGMRASRQAGSSIKYRSVRAIKSSLLILLLGCGSSDESAPHGGVVVGGRDDDDDDGVFKASSVFPARHCRWRRRRAGGRARAQARTRAHEPRDSSSAAE